MVSLAQHSNIFILKGILVEGFALCDACSLTVQWMVADIESIVEFTVAGFFPEETTAKLCNFQQNKDQQRMMLDPMFMIV